LAAGAGARLDAPAGQESKVRKRLVKTACPGHAVLRLGGRQRPGDTPPGVVDGLVDGAIAVAEAVSRVPDVARNIAPEHVVAVRRRTAHGSVRVNP